MQRVEALAAEYEEAKEEGYGAEDLGVDPEVLQEALDLKEQVTEALQTVKDLRATIRNRKKHVTLASAGASSKH